MKAVLVVVVIIVFIAVLANQGSSKNSSGNNTPAAQTSSDPIGDALNSHYSTSLKLCNAYDSLVNQGWTDDNIYKQLDDAGTFDKFGGTGPDFFKRLIKWCYAND